MPRIAVRPKSVIVIFVNSPFITDGYEMFGAVNSVAGLAGRGVAIRIVLALYVVLDTSDI